MPTSRREFAILTEIGLMFISCYKDPVIKDWVIRRVNEEEIYLKGQNDSLMLEYEEDKFLLGSLSGPDFAKIDRKAWQKDPNATDGI